MSAIIDWIRKKVLPYGGVGIKIFRNILPKNKKVRK